MLGCRISLGMFFFSGIFFVFLLSNNSRAICKFHDVSNGDFCLNVQAKAFLFMQALCLLQF